MPACAGLVIRNRARDASIVDGLLTAEAGSPMAMLVKRCTAEALTGLEFGISIPGTLGGAVWANAGAHGGEMRDVLEWVDAWDPASDTVARLDAADCAFAYRESRFKHSDEVVLAAALRLRPGDADRHRGGGGRAPGQAAGDAAAGRPERRQRLPQPARRPCRAADRGRRPEGPSGWAAPWSAPCTPTSSSPTAAARAADVRALGDLVRAAVADRFGVQLAYEIEFVGDWDAAEDGA